MRARVPLWPVAVSVVAVGVLGPQLTSPHDAKAGAPFAWEPPEGFVRVGSEPGTKYELADRTGHLFVPRAEVTHSANETQVEERELAPIVQGLPETFAKADVTWVARRHETRVRPDGARVGLIEGDCTKSLDDFRLQEVHFRKLQLVFPDDTGTSIVTIDYATDEAAKWEPIFEATIGKAKGVATRVPPAPAWMYGAWAAGGLVLGWLGASLLGTRSAAKAAAAKPVEEDEEDGEEEEEDEEEEEEAAS